MKISVADLKTAGACENQVVLFRQTFGEEPVEITLARCEEAAQRGLRLTWAAKNLLGPAAWARFEAETAPARKHYMAVRALLDSAARARCEATWAQYEAARAQYEAARARYVAETAPAFYAAAAVHGGRELLSITPA